MHIGSTTKSSGKIIADSPGRASRDKREDGDNLEGGFAVGTPFCRTLGSVHICGGLTGQVGEVAEAGTNEREDGAALAVTCLACGGTLSVR